MVWFTGVAAGMACPAAGAPVAEQFIGAACTKGEGELLDKLKVFEPVRAGTQLTLLRGDGTALFELATP